MTPESAGSAAGRYYALTINRYPQKVIFTSISFARISGVTEI